MIKEGVRRVEMLECDTIFFDLDGTLLPIDIEKFLERYFKLLTKEFYDLAEPDQLIKILMDSTRKMIENNGQKTNKDVFMEAFFSRLNVKDTDRVMVRFDQFYQNKFPLLKKGLNLDRQATDLINYLKKQDHRLVIATNPLFPRLAITERISWAGLDPADFSYITSYENMHYSKPSLDYYQELLDKLNLKAEDCFMIGNDMQEDIVAGKLGFFTYLVEDFVIDRETSSFNPDWRGTMDELIVYFKSVF